ncbi:hypothetical protein N665_0031s0006 [Sinapis alba]|nr:hypothetical protein N665_0031s0006 [Sinapis alba]
MCSFLDELPTLVSVYSFLDELPSSTAAHSSSFTNGSAQLFLHQRQRAFLPSPTTARSSPFTSRREQLPRQALLTSGSVQLFLHQRPRAASSTSSPHHGNAQLFLHQRSCAASSTSFPSPVVEHSSFGEIPSTPHISRHRRPKLLRSSDPPAATTSRTSGVLPSIATATVAARPSDDLRPETARPSDELPPTAARLSNDLPPTAARPSNDLHPATATTVARPTGETPSPFELQRSPIATPFFR